MEALVKPGKPTRFRLLFRTMVNEKGLNAHPLVEDQAMSLEESKSFLEQHGIGEIADQTVEAHGEEYTVAEAVRECPHLAKMITSLSVSLEAVPERENIIKNSIINSAAGTSNSEAVEAKKKV